MATPTNLYEYYTSQGQALPSVQARKTVASQAGIANYSGTAQQNQQLLSYLTGNKQTVAPSTPVTPTINATNIGSTTPMNIPAPTPAPNYNSLVASFAQDTQQAQEQQSQAQQGVQDSTNALLTLSRQLEGQTLEQQQLEQQQGIPQLNQDLLDLQNQARQRNLQYQQQFVTAEGKPVPMDVIVGEQAQLQRQNAIDIALINSNIQAKQGQLGLAQATVQSALNAKYEPIKAQIETQKLILDSNYKLLSSADKKLADAKQAELNMRLKEIEEQKQKENDIRSLSLTIAKNGAPLSVINKINGAQTFEDAIVSASPYLMSQADRADLAYKVAQTAKIYNDMKSDVGLSNVDPTNLLAYAQQYASDGKIPTGLPKGSFGAVAQYAKELPKQKGALVSSATGITSNTLGAKEQGDLTKLYNIVENVKKLKELDKKRVGGIVSGAVGKIFGSADQGAYLAVRKSIVDDIQRMQSGAALTAEEQSFYSGYLPGRFSEPLGLGQDSLKKIENFETIMNNKLKNSLATNGLSIYGYSKVNIGGSEYTVGDLITNASGQVGRVNPDGSITLVQ